MVEVSKIRLIPEPKSVRKTQLIRGSHARTKYACMHTAVLIEGGKILLEDASWRNEELVRLLMVIVYVLWEFLSQQPPRRSFSAQHTSPIVQPVCYEQGSIWSPPIISHPKALAIFCYGMPHGVLGAPKTQAKGKSVYPHRGPACYREEDRSILVSGMSRMLEE